MIRLAALRKRLSEAPWQLWTAQVAAILGIELKRSLHRFRNLWLYVLALVPVLLLGSRAMHALGPYWTVEADTQLFAYVFQIYLRLVVFFGCMGLFTWLFRGEIVQKSLHYYFLAPVRREVLVVGKFLSGFVIASLFFCVSVLLSFFLVYTHEDGPGVAYALHGPGLGQLAGYLAVTLLACAGYGAIFVAWSLFIRNPIIPGMIVFLWETFHSVFPALLQKLSVMFYLQQLCPVVIPPQGTLALFSVIVEPVSPWVAVPGLLCLSALVLTVACLKMRKLEISYLAD